MTDSRCNLRRHSEQRFCCSGCGRAFSSMDVFDHHRTGQKCADPATLLDKDGEPRGYVPRLEVGVVGKVQVWGGPGAPEFTLSRPPRRPAKAEGVPGEGSGQS